jgi:hypothetical protein
LLASAAARSTVAVRLALRDLVRYQACSAAALGAVTLAIGIAATIAITASAAEKPTGPGNLRRPADAVYQSRSGHQSDPSPQRLAAAHSGERSPTPSRTSSPTRRIIMRKLSVSRSLGRSPPSESPQLGPPAAPSQIVPLDLATDPTSAPEGS